MTFMPESLDLDLEYEPYILAQTINSEVAKKQHENNNNWINFPENPYDGQFFITLLQKIPLLMSFKKTGEGQWLMITNQDFSKPY